MKKHIIILLLLICPISLKAISFAGIFSEGMVLQQGNSTMIWGVAAPGIEVNIRLDNRRTYKCVAGETGEWQVCIATGKPGGPYSLEAYTSNDTARINEVYIGDVWLAGGQSNMYFTLNRNLEADKYIKAANDPLIRYARVPITLKAVDKPDKISWKEIDSESAPWTSAVAYFFACKLREHIDYPIGVISCNRGSTAAETWISEECAGKDSHLQSLIKEQQEIIENYKGGYEEKYTDYKKQMDAYNAGIKKGEKNLKRPSEPVGHYHPKYVSGMYKSMLKQVIPMTLKGTIWYQGEANASRADSYEHIFTTLIQDWRNNFNNPSMPFLFVQLSNYDVPRLDKEAWAKTREVQHQVSKKVKNTAMAASIDCGEEKDIHPRNKKPVGERLALLALNDVYKIKIPNKSPSLKDVKIKGNKIILIFDNVYKGLKTDSGSLDGIYISGKDLNFQKANATIIDKDKIEVTAPEISSPLYLRYRFGNWTEGNLYNSEGLPCIPFRTDRF